MPSTSSLTAFSNLLLTIYRSAQELPVDRFQDAILDAVKPLLAFDASMWGTATMTPAGIDIHNIHLHNFSQETLAAYERVKHQDTAAAQMSVTPCATIGFDAVTEFAGEDQAEIRSFSKDFGYRHFFITADHNALTQFVQWVTLFRSDPAAVCTGEQTALLELLAPHLMQALAINRLVHLDRLTGDVARESWSVAISDVKGVLYHADAGFRDLVRKEWGEGPAADRLPAGLVGLLADRGDQVAGRQTILQRRIEHGLLFLKARPRKPVDSLSTREFMVARLLASGLTQKEVAARLERSPDTIRSQVKMVFDKLRINNVAMLAPLLALRE